MTAGFSLNTTASCRGGTAIPVRVEVRSGIQEHSDDGGVFVECSRFMQGGAIPVPRIGVRARLQAVCHIFYRRRLEVLL